MTDTGLIIYTGGEKRQEAQETDQYHGRKMMNA